MAAGFTLSLILGYLPMLVFACIIYWFDRYEKEPIILLVLVFLWGSLIAALISFVLNTLAGMIVLFLSKSQIVANLSVASIIAPIIEETSKGIVVFLVFLLARKEFDSGIDGIVYGAIVGLGFAATENFYYIFRLGYTESGFMGLINMSIIRIGLVGWQHPFYTSFIGLGLSVARLSKKKVIQYLSPGFGLLLAIMTHAFHNTISSFLIENESGTGMLHTALIDWIGWLFVALLIMILIRKEQNNIQKYLMSEVTSGIMTPEQYRYTFNKAMQNSILHSLKKQAPEQIPRFKAFFQLSAELAHKLKQVESYGDEKGNIQLVLTTRNSLQKLARLILPFFSPM